MKKASPKKKEKKKSKLAALKRTLLGRGERKKRKKRVLVSPTKPVSKAQENKVQTVKAVSVEKTVSKPKVSKSTSRVKASPVPLVEQAGAGDPVCREIACEGLQTSGGYCRLHYIKNWKKIKRKEQILKEGKLNQYIEELVAKYPDKYIEAIRQDLMNDKDFAKVIYDLDLDESVDDFDVESENVDSLIDTIKRDFEDETETF